MTKAVLLFNTGLRLLVAGANNGGRAKRALIRANGPSGLLESDSYSGGMAHDQHHFVPAFLLREWQTGEDNKLTSLQWARSIVVANRYKAKSVAKQRHLYATGLAEGRPDNKLEREFMGPKVDDPAAVSHQLMLTDGIEALNEQDWVDWARFLVCQMVRTPRIVAHVRHQGREILMHGDEPVDAGVLEPGEPLTPLSQWLEEHKPGLFDNLGIDTLPYIVNSSLLNGVFLKATWATREMKHAKFDLLVSDTPLVYLGKMNSNFLFALPISPRKLFLAYSDEQTGNNVKRTKADAVAITFNRAQANQADSYVFSTNDKQRAIVARYLRKPDV